MAVQEILVRVVLWDDDKPLAHAPVKVDGVLPVVGDRFSWLAEGATTATICEVVRRDLDHKETSTEVTLHVVDVQRKEYMVSEQVALALSDIIGKSKEDPVHTAWNCATWLQSNYFLQRRRQS